MIAFIVFIFVLILLLTGVLFYALGGAILVYVAWVLIQSTK